MAKVYNNLIKTGKVAGSVFSVRYGEVIERAYNPIVANPQTDAQTSARARLKLLSQLSAVLGETIAMPRDGSKSPRNLFVKANYQNAVFTNGNADIPLAQIKLTRSAVGLPVPTIVREDQNLTAQLSLPVTGIDRVVYVMMVRDEDDKLRLYESKVVSESGNFNTWGTTFTYTTRPGVVLAYSVRDNTQAASVIFGDLIAPTAQQVARIITTRTLTESDVTLSETRGVLVQAPTV